ncbi:hypothetical protein [Algoriphagus algorifonticola]|uniref:hypothetical protein n=1 Tax=Algoriphagus algorifonticola TaxID=2593007 RepID=UPI0011AA469B|nr:hypothetical protein [Algoriphagus algorifonticola]
MKAFHLINYACFISLIFFSCEESKTTTHVEEAENPVSPIDADSQNPKTWLMKLMEKQPFSELEYLELVPSALQGFPLQSKEPKSGLNGFIAIYSHQEGSEHPGLRLEVIDGAGNNQFQHVNAVFKMLETARNESGDDFQSEIKDHKGERVLFVSKTKNDRKDYQLEYIQNHRYHVGILGNQVGPDEIYGAFDELQNNQFPK